MKFILKENSNFHILCFDSEGFFELSFERFSSDSFSQDSLMSVVCCLSCEDLIDIEMHLEDILSIMSVVFKYKSLCSEDLVIKMHHHIHIPMLFEFVFYVSMTRVFV
jgi:hypothetical protein